MSDSMIAADAAAAAVSFSTFGLSDAVLRAVYDVGYEAPSPIQAETIVPLLEGHDVIGQAQTGTGKTAAFALPLLSRLKPASASVQTLVLTPTRELAIQVAEAMRTYARYLDDFHVLPVYGGQSMSQQLRGLRRAPHVIVGTPGRVLDHIRRKTLRLDGLTSVVLDEADEMLRMGFIDDVEAILAATPETRQVALFSATLPASIRAIAERYTREPVSVRIGARTTTVESVRQRCWQVSGTHKLDALTRILETETFDAMLVFVRTKVATSELSDKLEARGFLCAPLNGDMNQATREQTIDRLRRGRLDIVVATDVAARGLDVERVTHVVNYDVPYDVEAYIHRIGRTGRAGRTGEAILFIAPRERRMLRTIERAIKQPITMMDLPTRHEVTNQRVQRFKARVSDVIEREQLEAYRDIAATFCAESDFSTDDLAAALIYLAQGDRPLVDGLPEEPPRKALADSDKMPAGEGISAGRRKHQKRLDEKRADETRPDKRSDNPDEVSPGESGHRDKRAGRKKRSADFEVVRYRLEVGSNDDVKTKNIVGAIANEAGLDSAYIGAVQIYDAYSTVELPEGMPREVFEHLRKVRIGGKRTRLSLDIGEGPLNDGTDGEKHRRPAKNNPGKRGKDKKRDKKKHRKSPASG